MDCVYQAYLDNLKFLHVRPYPWEYNYWVHLKSLTHGATPQFTFGGAAPWIVSKLAEKHALGVNVFYQVYTPSHFREVVKTYYPDREVQMRKAICFINLCGCMVSYFVNMPAIYLLLDMQHAIFSPTNQIRGKIVSQIYLYRLGG